MDYFRGYAFSEQLRREQARWNRLASGIEAPSGVETGNTDSTEGDGPTAESGDAHD